MAEKTPCFRFSKCIIYQSRDVHSLNENLVKMLSLMRGWRWVCLVSRLGSAKIYRLAAFFYYPAPQI
jgi:hypothetical protein